MYTIVFKVILPVDCLLCMYMNVIRMDPIQTHVGQFY